MPKISTYQDISITNAGGLIDIPTNDGYDYYNVYGSGVVLTGDFSIATSSTAQKGITYIFNYEGNGLDSNGHNVTIFGIILTAIQASLKCQIIAVYDGSDWTTKLLPSFDQNNVVNSNNIEDGSVVISKLSTDSNTFSITVPVSFETGRLGAANTIKFNHKIQLIGCDIEVNKLIEASNNATITFEINADSGTDIAIVIPAGSIQNSGVESDLHGSGLLATNYVSLIATKSTAGGEVLVTLIYKKI